MRYLGIDYGSKRVGIAMSDESGTMAFPHDVLPNSKDLLKQIELLIAEKGIDEVVIGHSLNGKNEANTIQEAIEAFMLDLTLASGVPIHLQPEQYTTQEAMRLQGRTDKTDASAAALILNSYLTRNS